MSLVSKIEKINDTNDLLNFFEKIINELNNKCKFSGIKKQELLKECKTKRNSNKEIWTKDVAKKLGEILKLIKKLDKLFEIYNNDDNNKKLGYIQFFGKLSEYSISIIV